MFRPGGGEWLGQQPLTWRWTAFVPPDAPTQVCSKPAAWLPRDPRNPRDVPAPAGSARRVVICGGGIMGAATAYYLAEKGLAEAVTVVERVEPACAASGGAGLRARGGVRG